MKDIHLLVIQAWKRKYFKNQ